MPTLRWRPNLDEGHVGCCGSGRIAWRETVQLWKPRANYFRFHHFLSPPPSSAIAFSDSGIGFGTLPPSTPPTLSFNLQPGIYQASLSIASVRSVGAGSQSQNFTLYLNGAASPAVWPIANFGAHSLSSVSGADRLFSVTVANSFATFVLVAPQATIPPQTPEAIVDGTSLIDGTLQPCLLILTQLH